jgi:hypothetical protein
MMGDASEEESMNYDDNDDIEMSGWEALIIGDLLAMID